MKTYKDYFYTDDTPIIRVVGDITQEISSVCENIVDGKCAMEYFVSVSETVNELQYIVAICGIKYDYGVHFENDCQYIYDIIKIIIYKFDINDLIFSDFFCDRIKFIILHFDTLISLGFDLKKMYDDKITAGQYLFNYFKNGNMKQEYFILGYIIDNDIININFLSKKDYLRIFINNDKSQKKIEIIENILDKKSFDKDFLEYVMIVSIIFGDTKIMKIVANYNLDINKISMKLIDKIMKMDLKKSRTTEAINIIDSLEPEKEHSVTLSMLMVIFNNFMNSSRIATFLVEDE